MVSCPDPPRFPSSTILSAGKSEMISLETDSEGKLLAIKKDDGCYSSVYDITLRTNTLTAKYDTYSSYYEQDTQILREKRYISSWFEWERETRVGQMATYKVNTELLDYYFPASVLVVYIFVAILALILLVFVRCCCH